MARASRERHGQQWATKFRESWGRSLFEKYDVHVLVSSYAQAPTKFYVAGLFYPPRAPEDAHTHAHHLAHHRKFGIDGIERGHNLNLVGPASGLGGAQDAAGALEFVQRRPFAVEAIEQFRVNRVSSFHAPFVVPLAA